MGMRKGLASLTLLLFAALPCLGQTMPGASSGSAQSWAWGLDASIEMGGMFILDSSGFDAMARDGYGSIGRDSITALFTLGAVLSRPRIVDLCLNLSYLGGGSFVWSEMFGHPEWEFSLYSDSLGIQLEIHPTLAFLHGIEPFAGAGWSLTNGLVDEVGDGFVRGWGPYVMGGLELFNDFGLKRTFLDRSGGTFFGLRASVYYRFPYAYSFKVGAFPDPSPAIVDYFSDSFPARSLAFGIGLYIGYAGWPLGGR